MSVKRCTTENKEAHLIVAIAVLRHVRGEKQKTTSDRFNMLISHGTHSFPQTFNFTAGNWNANTHLSFQMSLAQSRMHPQIYVHCISLACAKTRGHRIILMHSIKASAAIDVDRRQLGFLMCGTWGGSGGACP